jgi:hypothetical protein
MRLQALDAAGWVLGAADPLGSRWIMSDNGFTLDQTITIPVSRAGFPKYLRLINSVGRVVSNGTVGVPAKAKLGDNLMLPAGAFKFDVEPAANHE